MRKLKRNKIMYDEQDAEEEKRLDAMKLKILQAEKENLNTNEKSFPEMVELIRKIIKDEAYSYVIDNEVMKNNKDE